MRTACWEARHSGTTQSAPQLAWKAAPGPPWEGLSETATNKSVQNLKSFWVPGEGGLPGGGSRRHFSSSLLTQHPQVVDDYTAKKVGGVLQSQLQPVHLHSGDGEGLKGIGVLRVEIYNLAEGLPAP